jgi:hypothetical protein
MKGLKWFEDNLILTSEEVESFIKSWWENGLNLMDKESEEDQIACNEELTAGMAKIESLQKQGEYIGSASYGHDSLESEAWNISEKKRKQEDVIKGLRKRSQEMGFCEECQFKNGLNPCGSLLEQR